MKKNPKQSFCLLTLITFSLLANLTFFSPNIFANLPFLKRIHVTTSLPLASTYYSKDTLEKIDNGTLTNQTLKDNLLRVLNSTHRSVGYNTAKRFLFGQLHLKNSEQGYYVHDVYCRIDYQKGVGPNQVPDQNQINCEHTWPQSKFSSRFPDEIQKSDLHHLFPTDSKANSTRGNFHFADVSENKSGNLSHCGSSKSGPSVLEGGDHFFEPPTEHKGNVARALFYFSVKYSIAIDDKEEEFLRRWNDLDPIDAEEIARNEAIFQIQNSRNPFIDIVNLDDSIQNF